MRREVEKLDGMFVKLTSPSRDGMPDRMAILPGGRIVFVEGYAGGPEERQTTGGDL